MRWSPGERFEQGFPAGFAHVGCPNAESLLPRTLPPEIDKDPAMVFEVFFDTVIFLLHIPAVKKVEDTLFELASSLSADDLYLGELLVFSFLDSLLKCGIDLVPLGCTWGEGQRLGFSWTFVLS